MPKKAKNNSKTVNILLAAVLAFTILVLIILLKLMGMDLLKAVKYAIAIVILPLVVILMDKKMIKRKKCITALIHFLKRLF